MGCGPVIKKIQNEKSQVKKQEIEDVIVNQIRRNSKSNRSQQFQQRQTNQQIQDPFPKHQKLTSYQVYKHRQYIKKAMRQKQVVLPQLICPKILPIIPQQEKKLEKLELQ